jgi:hypothetical protein
MATVIKPPAPLEFDASLPSVFLAGSIEMGTAEDWQGQFEQALSDLDVVILNPRRDRWDSSWQQSIDNTPFRAQVEWELDGLDRASAIAMYFAAETKSPITLLELGLYAPSGKLLVCCPKSFWRRGNVEIVCARYNVPMVEKLADLIQLFRMRVISDSSLCRRNATNATNGGLPRAESTA